MPIEIKELHIKINVNGTEQTNDAANKQPGNKAQLSINTCIEEVMRIESRKKER